MRSSKYSAARPAGVRPARPTTSAALDPAPCRHGGVRQVPVQREAPARRDRRSRACRSRQMAPRTRRFRHGPHAPPAASSSGDLDAISDERRAESVRRPGRTATRTRPATGHGNVPRNGASGRPGRRLGAGSLDPRLQRGLRLLQLADIARRQVALAVQLIDAAVVRRDRLIERRPRACRLGGRRGDGVLPRASVGHRVLLGADRPAMRVDPHAVETRDRSRRRAPCVRARRDPRRAAAARGSRRGRACRSRRAVPSRPGLSAMSLRFERGDARRRGLPRRIAGRRAPPRPSSLPAAFISRCSSSARSSSRSVFDRAARRSDSACSSRMR